MPQRLRLALLLLATLAWLWASSPYTPWAADRAPRLWLYDLLFYLRVVLLAWLAAETAWLFFRHGRRTRTALAMLALACGAWLAAVLYVDSGPGWRWRTLASRAALETLAQAGYSDQRRRAGHLIVDNVRTPCGVHAPWLWLGRPHGAGSGINLALVRSAGVPDTPVAEAFVFRALGHGWWMAYENAAAHHAGTARRACSPGLTIATHRAGRAHMSGVRRADTAIGS